MVSFYSALHYVEAIIVRNNKQSSNHAERRTNMKTIPELRAINSDFSTLHNFAREARYDPATNFGASNQVQVICDLLDAIRNGLNF